MTINANIDGIIEFIQTFMLFTVESAVSFGKTTVRTAKTHIDNAFAISDVFIFIEITLFLCVKQKLFCNYNLSFFAGL